MSIKAYKIHKFEQLDSTNRYGLENIERIDNKSIILSETQNDGEGRLGRKWISSVPNNIYMSLVLKPSNCDYLGLPIANFTHYLAVVLVKVFKKYRIIARIKWPNDIFINGKKIAGILSKTSFTGDKFNGIVLGVGVNLNLTNEIVNSINQPATSLNLLLGKEVDRDLFLVELLDMFFKNYDFFVKKGFKYIKKDYIKHCETIGRFVKISVFDKVIEGDAVSIDNNGALLLKNKENKILNVNIGDVL